MSSPAQGSILTWDLSRSLASASMTGSYVAVGTPLTFPARILKCVNGTNMDVSLSIDGVNECDFVPASGAWVYDAGTNRGNSSPVLAIPEGTQIYASSAAGTGTLRIICLYVKTTPAAGVQ